MRSLIARSALRFGAVLGLTLAAWGASADDLAVDVELVLAVDVSLSMSPDELVIQRDGYVAALTDGAVLAAIADGVHGRIAVTYVEWAGSTVQQVVVPWTLIATAEDARAFVGKMTALPPRSARRTSISGALEFAGSLFEESGYRGAKRVIDVSGDGPNNQGGPVDQARDRIAARGITINGLPLMTGGGFASAYDIANLDSYYADCVIGGPGAFMIPVNGWAQFPEAIRRKLVLELADASHPIRAALEAQSPPVVSAAATIATDCQIGEKMWNNRGWIDIQ
ncbi:MAG: DUF1194 domain-containing protein [Mesorhizobium sp.]|nr:DUF1194 domain-containing protein [Mesorhizobium sp.]MCO5163302.1 DUF1194 domain-containing protein [Mesorhizobium sp.]